MSDIIKGAIDMLDADEAKAKSISVEQILKKIKEHTFGCMVAGGYCRDVFHGVAHKDIDIVMYNFYPDDFAEVVIANNLWKWLVDNVAAVNITAGDGENYDDKRIHFVWHLPYHNVDIICWNASTHHEVLNKFDCNLNQFYLPSTVPDFDSDEPYKPDLKETPVYFGSSPLEQLVFLKDLEGSRIERMCNKHKSFYPELWAKDKVEPVTYYKGKPEPTYLAGLGEGLDDIAW